VNSSYTHCGYTSITMQERIVPKGARLPIRERVPPTSIDVGNIVDGFVAIGKHRRRTGLQSRSRRPEPGLPISSSTPSGLFVDKFNTATRLWIRRTSRDLPTKVVATGPHSRPNQADGLRQDFSDSECGRFRRLSRTNLGGDPSPGAEI